MKWITRERVKVDRVACPWLIRKFVDPQAEFLADADNTLWHQPESAGLNALAKGFRHLGYKNDLEQNAAEWIVYDALYAYCGEMVGRGKPEGAFK